MEARTNLYVPLGARVVLANTMHFGKIFPLQTAGAGSGTGCGAANPITVPVNRRLYANGRVRGYPIKTLLPQDVTVDPATGSTCNPISSGGLLFAAANTEVRILLYGALWIAGFFDVGDLWESGRFSLMTNTPLVDGSEVSRTFAMGTGVGLRVTTPVGPLSVDFAFPVNARDPGADDLTIHFAVGAF